MDYGDPLGQELDQILDAAAQQQRAQMQQLQQLLNQPALQQNDHLMQLHQQLQQIQQLQALPAQQAQQVPLPQPQQQPQAAAPVAAPHAQQVQMPQFHVHMMPAAGFMEGAFAAIPVVGFAPFQAGQFPPQIRRRLAFPRRAAAAVPPVGAAAQADLQAQLEAVLNAGLEQEQQHGEDQHEGAAAPPAFADGAAAPLAAAHDAVPDPLHPEQQQQQRAAIRIQFLAGAPPAGVRDPHAIGLDNEHPVMLQDPEELMQFDDDFFGPLRAEAADDDVGERSRVEGERTPPRDVPARIEDPEAQEMNASCPICILPFKNGADGGRVARVLSCGHLICTGCVKLFCRNLKENRSLAYHSYDRAPCVVCQRTVRWRGLPECKTVGYLYEQLELTNEERTPVDDAAKIRAETRKRTYRHLDNLSSSCHEMATKIRKLVRKADGVYDLSLETSSHSVGRETMSRIACVEHADWMVKKVEEEANRVEALEKQFNEHYDKMNQILEEISSKPFTLPKVFPKPEQPSTSSG